MTTEIKAKKTLYNKGKCFVKGHIYGVLGTPINNEASLMERQVINELGEPHIIGSWWREFKIINKHY